MKWVKNNVTVLCFLAVVLLFVGTGAHNIMQQHKEVKEIEIVAGDTLWSLAQQYSNEEDLHKWIHQVKKENNLIDSKIVAGKTLVIPSTVKDSNQIEIASDK